MNLASLKILAERFRLVADDPGAVRSLVATFRKVHETDWDVYQLMNRIDGARTGDEVRRVIDDLQAEG